MFDWLLFSHFEFKLQFNASKLFKKFPLIYK